MRYYDELWADHLIYPESGEKNFERTPSYKWFSID